MNSTGKTPFFLAVLIVTSSLYLGYSLPVRGTTAGSVLYASPIHTADLPVGNSFNVSIKVANFAPFNAWDIHVGVDPGVLNPVGLTISGNIFSENVTNSLPTELARCIDGSGIPATACSNDPYADPGIVYSAAVDLSNNQTVTGNGLLFTVTYNVIGAGFSNITIFADKIPNGSTVPVAHTTWSATYGTPTIQPGFKIQANPTDLEMTLSLLKGASQNSTITLTSIDGFSGTASLSARTKTTLPASFYPNNVFLPANGANGSTIRVSASGSTPSALYYVIVSAAIGSITHQQILTVHLNPYQDFIMSVLPSLLKIHAGSSGSALVKLDTQTGFSGTVHLKMDVPPVNGLLATLGATDLAISPGQPASTLFVVRTPPSALLFYPYLINITASSPNAPPHLPFTITVKPPSPDFSVQVYGSASLIAAGQSRTYTINMTSVDYFKGQLYLLAISLSGIQAEFTRSSVTLDYENSSISQSSKVTVTTDRYLSPGNHYLSVTVLGTSFLGISVNHTITETIAIGLPPVVLTILGIQPVTYFGIIGVLWIALLAAVVREVRKPKRFLS